MADDTYHSEDDDPDAAAMAEAMGFTGFGMQRSKKRKLPTPPSQTGANNAPLGKRRLPLSLPRPVVSGGDNGNPAEIDLDGDDEDEGVGVGVETAAAGGVDEDGDGEDGVNERAAALTVDDDAPSTSGPQHHPLPPRPQQDHHHAARRPGGGRGGGPGPGQGQTRPPWWEGEWDPRHVGRMVENPWDRLEKQRGLEARGTWPSTTATARGAGGPAAAPARPRDNEKEDARSSGGVAGGPLGAAPTTTEEPLSGRISPSRRIDPGGQVMFGEEFPARVGPVYQEED